MMKHYFKTTNYLKEMRPGIWLTGTSFVLLQFFLQLSSGVVIAYIMNDMHLSALEAGTLSGSFYIIYTALQIPVGILCDRNNPRPLLMYSALICGVGCLIFASSYSLTGLYVGRVLIGIGSAFAFVGLTHLVRQHYPNKQFASLIGITETLSFIVTVIGIISLGRFIIKYGWREFINCAAITAFLIAFLYWKYIPNEIKTNAQIESYSNQLKQVLCNKLLWVNGLFIGLSFAIVTVFGALWSVPFLQVKLNCTMFQASVVTSFFFLGTGFSCPIFAILSNMVSKRNPLIIGSCLITAIILLIIIYVPTQNKIITIILMFILGLVCGSYILAYNISNELASKHTLSTCSGFTNTLALITTPLLQPMIGYILEKVHTKGTYYSLENYQTSLVILPLCLIIACILVYFLPEKIHKSMID